MKLLPLQREWSVTVALLSLAELVWLGLVIPHVKTGLAVIGAPENSIVLSLHWSWCIPIGVLLAAGLIAKDFWCRPVVAGRINLAVFWVGILIWGVCVTHVCLRYVIYR
jgi:hypothetical protein